MTIIYKQNTNENSCHRPAVGDTGTEDKAEEAEPEQLGSLFDPRTAAA
jgi:hypothetical protein